MWTRHPLRCLAALLGLLGVLAGCGTRPDPGVAVTGEAKMPRTVVELIDNDPRLTELAAALQSAGLKTELGAVPRVTVFAPTDEALAAALGGAQPSAEELTKLLTYHVVTSELTEDDIASAGSLDTLAGEPLDPDDIEIVDGDLKAINGRVQVIDKVLQPPS